MSTPTVVLVHGAFADSSSWNEVIARHGRRTGRDAAAQKSAATRGYSTVVPTDQ